MPRKAGQAGSVVAMPAHSGAPTVEAAADITERERAEMTLAESEQRFRLLAENSTDVLWSMGLDGRLTYASPSVEKLRGYTVAEVMAQSTDQRLTPDGMKVFQKEMAAILETIATGRDVGEPRTCEVEQPHKNGSMVRTEMSIGIMRSEHGEPIGFHGSSRDISERKRAQEAVQESEQKFRQAFMTGLDAAYLATLDDGRVTDCNTEFETLFGYTRQEIIGKTSTELNLYADPTDRRRLVSILKDEGRVKDLELKGRRKTGETFDVSVSASILQTTGVPRTLGLLRDVTERTRAAESLMAQNRLLENARQQLSAQVEEKARFVATVSHELRTPLAVVLGFAAELCDGAATLPRSEVSEFAGLIREGAAAANNLVEDLLIAARIGIGPIAFTPEAVDLERAVAAVAAEAETASHIRLKSLELAGTGTVAWADLLRVHQIVRNLLVNAGRHGGPNITVTSGVCGDSPAVFCRVVDDGPGVPEHLLGVLFDPYQHGTRDAGVTESVGLGLYLSRNLARLMGGDLTHDRDGASTVFELTLPGGRVAAVA
ncbi:MAG: PAS domain-containing sensor histidine kinase [Actinobacteria bacterium]|nr:PAS domain-containing sensor histidine kinase [Actinomycetota bacterium]